MVDQVERLSQTLHLAMHGIRFAQNSHRIAEFLDRMDKSSVLGPSPNRPEGGYALEGAKAEAELASREVEQDFPILHAQATVTLWAYLEACVRRLLADWITHDPRCLTNTAFEKVKVRLAEYERLDDIDKGFYVVDILERELAAGLQNGVSRFDSLLGALNLRVDVPNDLRRDIFEIGQVRNVIMHRAGIVDRKFADACQWLDLRPGAEHRVTHRAFGRYANAVGEYHFLILLSVGEHFGVDVSKERTGIFERHRRAPLIESETIPGAY